MRCCVMLLVAAGCGFDIAAGPDAPPDTPPPDIAITWTVDATSGKATPATADEWRSFLAAHNLTIAAPNGLWPMQDPATPGTLVDVIGSVHLAPRNIPRYQQTVAGWARRAAGTDNHTAAEFYNNSATALPDVRTQSMTVLMIYQTVSEPTPTGVRSIAFGGSGPPGYRADVELDAARHLRMSVNTSVASGTIDYAAAAIPIVMKLDVTNQQQKIITHREVIQPMYVPLLSSRGLVLGGANFLSPEGRWLYMAAWFGPAAEISDANVAAMLTALGW